MTTNTNTAFTDELVWVHHDAGHMNALPHRARVFSHIQGNYRTWRRREDARNARTWIWKEPLGMPQETDGKPNNGKARVEPNQNQNHSCGSNARRLLPSQRGQTAALTVRATSPLSFMGQGNSDPFNVFSITIGPDENNLIGLYRDYLLPLMYHLATGYQMVNELAARDWEDNIEGLKEAGTALGTLARYGAMASKCNANMRPVALKFLGQSVRALRDKVSRSQELDDNFDCLHINMLFNAEIINGNLAGAVAHGRMFTHIFRRQWKQGNLDYKMLLYELHNDLQLTSTFLIRPLFDVDDWLPMVLKPLFDMAAPHLPAFCEGFLDPAIEDEYLGYWFGRRRSGMYWESLQSTGPADLPQLPIMVAAYTAQTFLFHSRMMSYYLDSKEKLQRPGLTDKDRSSLYVHQYLALAAIQELKWSVYNPYLMGVPIYDSILLFKTLRVDLEESEALSKGSEEAEHMNARIWALYIGALAESQYVTQRARLNQQWFRKKLAEQAWKMQIFTWDDLVAVLSGFLYEEKALSQGSAWFEELVLNYQLGEEIERYLSNLSPASR